MANINDLKQTLYGGGNIIDGEVAWLESWGATKSHIIDMWVEVLASYGYTGGYEQAKHDWLYAQTGINNVVDAEYYALNNGLYTFLPTPLLQWDARDSGLMTFNGSKIMTWADNKQGKTISQGTDSKRPTLSGDWAVFSKAALQYLTTSALSEMAVGTGDFTMRVVYKSTDIGQTNPDVIAGQGSSSEDGFWHQVAYNTNDKNLFIQSDGVSALEFVTSDNVVSGAVLKVATGVVESGVLKQYINGVLQADTNATTLDVQTTTSPFCVGTRDNNELFTFNGSIAQVTIYNVAVSQTQETIIYNQINDIWG